jgi:hypothetical protein
MSGLHPLATLAYAEALAGPGQVLAVPAWRAHLVRRAIAGGGCDAAGVYPLQVLAPGADVAAGLQALAGEGLVSAVMVPDPLLCPAEALAPHFDVCRPFKTHFLIDPARGPCAPSKHHRYEIRRGQRRCRIERVALADWLEVWSELYAELSARRDIAGAAAFSPAYFRMLAGLPELTAFAALVDGACAGMGLWFAAEGVVYNHLGAANALGYANGASFALYAAAIEHFAGCGVVNLGGGAGLGDDERGGLAAFKRGFANAETQAQICGAVLDRARYAELAAGREDASFFPAYRAP